MLTRALSHLILKGTSGDQQRNAFQCYSSKKTFGNICKMLEKVWKPIHIHCLSKSECRCGRDVLQQHPALNSTYLHFTAIYSPSFWTFFFLLIQISKFVKLIKASLLGNCTRLCDALFKHQIWKLLRKRNQSLDILIKPKNSILLWGLKKYFIIF